MAGTEPASGLPMRMAPPCTSNSQRVFVGSNFGRDSILSLLLRPPQTLCYAIMLPGRRSAFRAKFWQDCCRKRTEISPPAGLRPAGGPISVFSR